MLVNEWRVGGSSCTSWSSEGLVLQLSIPWDSTLPLWLKPLNLLTFSNPDPRMMDKILEVKSDAQMLRGRVDNVSTLHSDLEKEKSRVEEAEVQMQILNTSLSRVHSQILTLRNSMEVVSAHITMLTGSWEEVGNLNAKIPELQRDLDKASALNAKVRGLQNSLENVNKLLQTQSK